MNLSLNKPTNKKTLIYDLPLRMFHWLFALYFVCSFVFATYVDSESILYFYHMLLGFCLGFFVLLRLIWGLIGTKYSKFKSFELNPLKLVTYFFQLPTKSRKIWAGHNPASSWVAIVMFFCALGLAVTGFLMTQGFGEELEDIHIILSDTFAVTCLLHIAGIIIHTLLHKDVIGLSMVHGGKYKVPDPDNDKIQSTKTKTGLLSLGLAILFTLFIFANFDEETKTVKIFGTQIQLDD